MCFPKQSVCLITGASGFIGSQIAQQLVEAPNCNVHICVRIHSDTYRLSSILDSTFVHYVDLENIQEVSELIHRIQPNYIFNAAYQNQINNTNPASSINLVILRNILEACKGRQVTSIVHTCSSMIYKRSLNPFKESSIIEPFNFRGKVKKLQRDMCIYYANQYNLPLVLGRIFRAYGPYEQENRLLLTLLKAQSNNTAVSLAPNSVVRDYIFIDDLVTALLSMSIANLPPGTELNLGSGTQASAMKIRQIIETLNDKPIKVSSNNYTKGKGDRNHCIADIAKAQALINWTPIVSLEEGILRLNEWYKSRITS